MGSLLAVLSGAPAFDGLPIHICALGDSITADNTFANAGSNSRRAYGDIITTQFLMNQRFTWSAADNLGVAGNTTTQMAARLSDIDARQAAGADVCFFMGGINDVTTEVALGTITANYEAIIGHITETLGMVAIVRPVLPCSSWGAFSAGQIATAKQKIKDCNAYLAALCNGHPRAFFVHGLYDAFNNGSDEPKTDYTRDGKHLETVGAAVVGRYQSNLLATLYGAGRALPLGYSNLLANPTLGGTGGTGTPSNLTVTGDKPTSFVLSATVTGGTNTLNLTRDGDGNLIVDFTSVSGGTTHFIQLSQQVNASGNFTAADLVQARAVVEMLESTNANSVYLRVTDTAGATKIYSEFEKSGASKFPAGLLGAGILATDLFNPGASPSSITWAIRAEVNSSGQTARIRFKLRHASLIKAI